MAVVSNIRHVPLYKQVDTLGLYWQIKQVKAKWHADLSRDWTTWNLSLRLKAQCDIRIAPVINGDEVQQLFYLSDMTFWLEQNDLIHDELPTSSPDATGRSKHEQMAHSAPVTSLIHKLLPICWSLFVYFILKDFPVENLLLSENSMAIEIHPWCAVERSTCVYMTPVYRSLLSPITCKYPIKCPAHIMLDTLSASASHRVEKSLSSLCCHSQLGRRSDCITSRVMAGPKPASILRGKVGGVKQLLLFVYETQQHMSEWWGPSPPWAARLPAWCLKVAAVWTILPVSCALCHLSPAECGPLSLPTSCRSRSWAALTGLLCSSARSTYSPPTLN